MATDPIRATRHALLIVALMALAACASRPGVRPQKPIHPIMAAPAVATPASPPPLPPPSASVAQESALTPAQYADLFDRIRAGFTLPDPDQPAIADEVDWYASHPKYLQRAFGRADLYLYYIVTQLEKRHMPLELAFLPVIESGFQPFAYSYARAAGLWQFISDTGKLYGLKQDWWYDGRRDVIASTDAALTYLQALHDQFGNWLLAIAAYNCGALEVQHAIEVNEYLHRPTDFWHLRLPRQTESYVPALLAMKRLVADPAKYGLAFSPIPNQPYFTRVNTDGQINLQVAAQIAGISADQLYELNPAFHRWATDPTGPFYLLLPVNAAPIFEQNIAELTPDERMGLEHYVVHRGDTIDSIARRFKTSVTILSRLNSLHYGRLTVGSDIEVPAAVYTLPEKVRLAAARVDAMSRWGRHFRIQIVHQGDSLWEIAHRYGMNEYALARMNGLSLHSILHPGERLRLYASAPLDRYGNLRFQVVRTGDTLWSIARRHGMSVSTLARLNGLSAGGIIHPGERLRLYASAGGTGFVIVRPGDSLWSIAERNGMNVYALARLNGLSSRDILRPGEKLRIAPRRAQLRKVSYHPESGFAAKVRRVIYTVRSGDTLWQIARLFQVKVAQIIAWNSMSPRSPIIAGQKLLIRVAADAGG